MKTAFTDIKELEEFVDLIARLYNERPRVTARKRSGCKKIVFTVNW